MFLTMAIALASTAQISNVGASQGSDAMIRSVGREAPLGRDRKGRPTMPVSIDGQGPYAMVIDTAAQISMLAPDLATALHLPPVRTDLRVNGIAGSGGTRMVGVDRLSSPLFDATGIALPTLASGAVSDARGVIGMDQFGTGKLVIDTAARMVRMVPSGPSGAGFYGIEGETLDGTFLAIPVTLDGHRVRAIVDSGAEGTVGDAALLKVLGWKADDTRLKAYGEIRGAGRGAVPVRAATVGLFKIGPVNLRDVPVMISGEPVSEGTDADGVPTILLGSDLLNLLVGYAVDLPRHRFEIRLPGK